MNRHQRRKLSRARKEAKAAILNSRAMSVLKEETRKRNLAERRPNRFERSGCLGNRGIYQAIGMYPTQGYGGGFKSDGISLSDRSLAKLQARFGKPRA